MKHKRGLLISVMSCLCALSLTAACGKGGDSSSSGRTETAEGVETGVYYYDADGEEYLISLNSGNRFTFLVMGEKNRASTRLRATRSPSISRWTQTAKFPRPLPATF